MKASRSRAQGRGLEEARHLCSPDHCASAAPRGAAAAAAVAARRRGGSGAPRTRRPCAKGAAASPSPPPSRAPPPSPCTTALRRPLRQCSTAAASQGAADASVRAAAGRELSLPTVQSWQLQSSPANGERKSEMTTRAWGGGRACTCPRPRPRGCVAAGTCGARGRGRSGNCRDSDSLKPIARTWPGYGCEDCFVGAGTLLVDIEAPFRRLKGAGPCEGGLSFAGAIPTRSDSTLAAVVRGLSPGLRGEDAIGAEGGVLPGEARSQEVLMPQ